MFLNVSPASDLNNPPHPALQDGDPLLARLIEEEMPWQGVEKATVDEELLERFGDEVANFRVGERDLFADFLPAIKQGDDVFQVMTRHEVTFAAAPEGIKLRRDKIGRRHDPDRQ